MKFKLVYLFKLFFLILITLFLFSNPRETYAHDNANGNCIHVPNQWVSCGSANFCNGPDLVNNWELCFIEADGVTHTGCHISVANELHQANAPQCLPPSPPPSPNASCPDPGTAPVLKWDAVSGASSYQVRVDNITAGPWNNSCDAANNGPVNDGDVCTAVPNNSYPFSGRPGNDYRWWVRACNGNGCSNDTAGPNFICQAPAPTATPTPQPKNPPCPIPAGLPGAGGGYGDVDGDGMVSMNDVQQIQRAVAGLETFDAAKLEAGNVTGAPGVASTAVVGGDPLKLLRYLGNLDPASSFSVCGAVPTVTPSPTPTGVPPACGTTCTIPADCAAARDGCTTCPSGGGVCSPPPTSTPNPTSPPGATNPPPQATATPRPTSPPGATNPPPNPTATSIPPACGVACTIPADCQAARDGCTACVNNICAVPPTSAPAPSPTPAFNPAACKCDGIDTTDIFSGQQVAVTSFAKVMGVDVPAAQVANQQFFLAEGAETMAKIIARSGVMPANIISNTPTLVRYSSIWNLTIPQLKSGATYRIWSQISCVPKTNAFNYSESKSVLGTNTQNPSIFDRIFQFFALLFGGKTQKQNIATSPTATPVPQMPLNQANYVTPTKRDNLQLDTFYPAEIYQKTCSFIKFRYDGP